MAGAVQCNQEGNENAGRKGLAGADKRHQTGDENAGRKKLAGAVQCCQTGNENTGSKAVADEEEREADHGFSEKALTELRKQKGGKRHVDDPYTDRADSRSLYFAA